MSLSDLRSKLVLRDSELIGCQRRNRWHPQPTDWRLLRGNAILEAAGRRMEVVTPAGTFETYVAFGWYKVGECVVLTFRGGRWKPWWDDDLRLLAALVTRYHYPVTGVVALNELDGELREHYVSAPSSEWADEAIRKAIERWEGSQRIPKNSDRAKSYCLYCPVKARCDALDLEKGDTNDWPPDYRVG